MGGESEAKSKLITSSIGKKKWRWRALIPLPRACEARALPFELHPHCIFCQSIAVVFIVLIIKVK